MKVKGAYLILIRDAKTLKLLERIKIRNVITTNFINQLPSTIYGNHPFTFLRSVAPNQTGCPSLMRKYWYIVLGTGSGTPSESDTELFTPVSATAKHGSISHSGNQAQYYVRYLPEEINGYTYTEIGVYDLITGHWVSHVPGSYTWEWYNYTSGTLLTHALISPAIEKTSDILLDCYAQITFTS